MAKVSKNLSLDETAVARGERYSKKYDTNLSRLVSDFLAQLPVDDVAVALPPIVRGLVGIAISEEAPRNVRQGRQRYRSHLEAKYGKR